MSYEKWALVPVTVCFDGTDECRRYKNCGLPCEGCLGNGYRIMPDAHMVRVATNNAGKPIAVDFDE
jgi:hypothetical protein